jgi:hypothetical protein
MAASLISMMSSLGGPVLGIVCAVIGGGVLEYSKNLRASSPSKDSVIGRWYWQVTYRPGETNWRAIWSIELVRIYRDGEKIWGTMYRVYPAHFTRRWEFTGYLRRERHLILNYRSIGKEFGVDGTMQLGILTKRNWCGTFEAIPEPASEGRVRAAQADSAMSRIGPDFSEKALVEWVAADHDPDDAVRGFLALLPATGDGGLEESLRELPVAAREIVTTPPPYPSWLMKHCQALGAIAFPLAMSVVYGMQRLSAARARLWDSPAARLLPKQDVKGDDDPGGMAQTRGKR